MHNKKDITEKKLEDYPEVFADIFNVLLFRKEYIEKEHLKSGATESIYKEQLQSRLQQRDVLKYYKGVGMNVASLGIENQSAIDKYMPIRVMGYDYGSYRRQVDHKENVHAVITLVLNFSGREWNAAKSLSALMKLPDEMQPFFQDYQVHIVDMCNLDDQTIRKFTSDFKSIAAFFTYGNDYLKHEELYHELEHVDEVIDLLRTFNEHTDDNKLDRLIIKNQNGGNVTMCDIIKEIEDKGREEGREEGRAALLITLVKDGDLSIEKAAERLHVSKEEFMQLMEQ